MEETVTPKYPLEHTACPTKLDKQIAAKAEWLRTNNRGLWEKAQSAPSEITFKIFILQCIGFSYADDIEDYENGITDKLPRPYATIRELHEHPNLSLEDLEWEYKRYRAMNSPAVIPAKERLDAFKRKHGIIDTDQ